MNAQDQKFLIEALERVGTATPEHKKLIRKIVVDPKFHQRELKKARELKTDDYLISMKEAAEELRCTPNTVRNYCERGILTRKMNGKFQMVSLKEVREFRKNGTGIEVKSKEAVSEASQKAAGILAQMVLLNNKLQSTIS